MITGLVFTLGCLLPLLLMDLFYLFQDKKHELNGFFYNALIIVDIIMIISEVVSSVFLFKERNLSLGNLFLRFHWICGLLLFYAIFVYGYILIKNCRTITMSELFKKHKTVLIVSIMTLIITIVYFILPLPKMNYNELDYLPGWLAYILIIYATITLGVNIVTYFMSTPKYKNARNILLTVFLMAPAYVVIQFIFQKIAFGPLVASFIIIVYYIIEENPNKSLSNEMNEVNTELENNNNIMNNILSNLSEENDGLINDTLNICNKYKDLNELNNEEYSNDLLKLNENINDILFNIKNRMTALSNYQIKETNVYSFDVLEVIKKFQLFALNKIGKKGIKLIINIDSGIYRKINGDEDAFYYILTNAFINSLKTTKVGRITINIKKDIANNVININMSDTGEGRKKEEFQEIEKYDKNFTILKEYLKSFNGRYEVSGELNLGTIIDMYLEVVPTSGEVIEKQTLTDIDLSLKLRNMEQKKLLLVENNDMNRFALNQILNMYNIQFSYVDNIDAALNHIKQGDTFDYVFIDTLVSTDDINLAQTIKKLCNDFGYQAPRIVALVSFNTKKYERKMISEGYDNSISLGLDLDELNKLFDKQ